MCAIEIDNKNISYKTIFTPVPLIRINKYYSFQLANRKFNEKLH